MEQDPRSRTDECDQLHQAMSSRTGRFRGWSHGSWYGDHVSGRKPYLRFRMTGHVTAYALAVWLSRAGGTELTPGALSGFVIVSKMLRPKSSVSAVEV